MYVSSWNPLGKKRRNFFLHFAAPVNCEEPLAGLAALILAPLFVLGDYVTDSTVWVQVASAVLALRHRVASLCQ